MSKQDSHLNCVSITKSEYNDSQFEDLSNKNTFDTCTISNNELTENKTPFLLPNAINTTEKTNSNESLPLIEDAKIIDSQLSKNIESPIPTNYINNINNANINTDNTNTDNTNTNNTITNNTITNNTNTNDLNNTNNCIFNESSKILNQDKNLKSDIGILNSFQNTIITTNEKFDSKQVKISLVDEKLWEKFHAYVNEMIVTKDGRRMFPVLKIKVEGLDPSSMYTVNMDFSISDNHRWKFMNGRWIRGNKEDNIKNSSIYMHCDSPNFGTFWLNNSISFSKLKISNKVSKDPSKIQIHSLFRYLPRIHIYSIDNNTRGLTHIVTKHFDCTEFIAVTAYQNDAITRLKVSYNPFAKAFLDVKRSINESPLHHSSISQNRDIYKPYENHNHKIYNNINKDLKTSNMYIDNKQISSLNNNNYNQISNNSSSIFYNQTTSNDLNSQRQLCSNTSNLPHCCDYFHTSDLTRNNNETRPNSNVSFYDNNSNCKNHGYPYVYQYGCPTNYYYDKTQPFLTNNTTNYLYSNKNETQNTSIAQSQCYNLRNFTNQSLSQYNTSYNNCQNLPLYKDLKISNKNNIKTQIPVTAVTSNICDDKFNNNNNNDKRIAEQ